MCTHVWLEEAYTTKTAALAPECPLKAPAQEAVTEAVAPPAIRERRRRPPQVKLKTEQETSNGSAMMGLTLVAGIVLLLAAGLAARETIVRQLPWMARPYAALGLPVNIQGLEFRDVRSRIMAEAYQKVLTIDGQISNLRAETQSLPDLQLSLRDAAGREVYAWSAAPPKATLMRGETIQFRARLAAPPDAAQAVRVQFSESTRSVLQ